MDRRRDQRRRPRPRSRPARPPPGGVARPAARLDPASRLHYDVVSNGVLWFLHHGLFDLARRPRFDRHFREAWEGYVDREPRVRRRGRRRRGRTASRARPGLPARGSSPHMVARAPTRPAGRALHPHAVLRPELDPGAARRRGRRDLLVDGRGAPTGFHTERWARAFRASAARCSASDAGDRPHVRGAVRPRPRGAAPRAASPEVAAELAALDERVGDRQLIVRSDRIELSKNIVRGFLAYDLLLEEHPELRGRVVFVAMLNPSRESLPEYLAYRNEVEQAAARVNDRWATARLGAGDARPARQLRPLARRARAQRRAAREPGQRRAQPRREGRPARQPARRRAVPLARGRRARRAAPRVPRRAALRRRADRGDAARGARDGRAPSGRAARGELRAHARANPPAAWLEHQLRQAHA